MDENVEWMVELGGEYEGDYWYSANMDYDAVWRNLVFIQGFPEEIILTKREE